MNKSTKISLTFFGTLLIFIIWKVGMFYENETDIWLKNYTNFTFVDIQFTLPITYGLNTFWDVMTAYLYRVNSSIPWYDVISFCLSIIFTGWVVKYAFELSSKYQGILQTAIVILLSVFTIHHVIIFDITRNTFFLFVVFLFSFFVSARNNNKVRWLMVMGYSAALLLLNFRRIESFIVALFVLFPFLLLAILNDIKERKGAFPFKNYLTFVIAVSIVLSISFLVANYPWSPKDSAYLQIRPYENTLVDFDKSAKLVSFTNAKDSAIYHLASHFFFTDTSVINRAFYDRINLKPLDKNISYINNYFKYFHFSSFKWEKLKEILISYAWLILLLIATSIVSVNFRKWILLDFFMIASVIVISLVMKPEDHIVFPILFMTLLLKLVMINVRYAKPLSVLLLIGSLIYGIQAGNMIFEKHQENEYLREVTHTVKQYDTNYKLPFVSYWDKFNGKLFQEKHYCKENETCISFDNGILYIDQAYWNAMQSITASDSFVGQVKFFLENHKETIYIASEQRIKMWVDYLFAVYSLNLECELLQTFPVPQKSDYINSPLGIYKLRLSENELSRQQSTHPCR